MFTLYNNSRKEFCTFECTASSVEELMCLLFLACPYLSDVSLCRVRNWASCPNGSLTYSSKRYNFLIVRDIRKEF